MKKIFFIAITFFFLSSANAISGEKLWWEKWNRFPDVPRISAERVKKLFHSGEKLIFIYAGYDVDDVLCGSLYLPYTLVPPESDGSKVDLSALNKDWWIMCY